MPNAKISTASPPVADHSVVSKAKTLLDRTVHRLEKHSPAQQRPDNRRKAKIHLSIFDIAQLSQAAQRKQGIADQSKDYFVHLSPKRCLAFHCVVPLSAAHTRKAKINLSLFRSRSAPSYAQRRKLQNSEPKP